MRTSKLIAPVRDALQHLFAEELKLGHLITKMISISVGICFLFIFGCMMRYSDAWWPVVCWILLCTAALIRFVIRYWWPVLWQKMSNCYKKAINMTREDTFLEIDTVSKYPFLCTNCRHPKLYYEKMEPEGSMRIDKPICKKCSTTDAVRVYIAYHPNPIGTDTGPDEYLSPEVAEALKTKNT